MADQRPNIQSDVDRLGAVEGVRLLTSHQAIVKGAFESTHEIGAIYGPRRMPFTGLFDLLGDDRTRELLKRHGLDLRMVPHAC
ncbi:MAG: hypothetical protein ACYTGR_11705, partial [Planctomycetota bacterium]